MSSHNFLPSGACGYEGQMMGVISITCSALTKTMQVVSPACCRMSRAATFQQCPCRPAKRENHSYILDLTRVLLQCTRRVNFNSNALKRMNKILPTAIYKVRLRSHQELLYKFLSLVPTSRCRWKLQVSFPGRAITLDATCEEP